MRLDLNQAETERIAREQSAMLDDARLKLEAGQHLSPLEQSGILHTLQVLVENAIGKAKHTLKAVGIRNRIVHDYMTIDMDVILGLLRAARHHFVSEYLMRPFSLTGDV